MSKHHEQEQPDLPEDPLAVARLAELEHIVETGLRTFVEVGLALSEIRDTHLYLRSDPTIRNFGDYLKRRWGMGRAQGYRLIDAASVAQIVSPIGDIPNEATARELVPLLRHDREGLKEVWSMVKFAGKKPTARQVRGIVDTYRDRHRHAIGGRARRRLDREHAKETLDRVIQLVGDVDVHPFTLIWLAPDDPEERFVRALHRTLTTLGYISSLVGRYRVDITFTEDAPTTLAEDPRPEGQRGAGLWDGRPSRPGDWS